jgi:TatA/E family protein of Tat protein translocase
MFDLSPIKIVLIVAVILLVMGPDKLPDVARQMGTAWRTLREWQHRIEKEVRDVVPDLPSSADIARLARSPVSLLNQLADRVSTPMTDAEFAEISGESPATSDAAASPSMTTSPGDVPNATDDDFEEPEEPPTPSRLSSQTLPTDPSLN